MEQLTSILKDLANQLVSPLRTWFDGLEQRDVLLPMLFVLLVVVFRKPLAVAAVQFGTFIGEKIGLTISKDVQDTINPAVQTLIVSLALLIGVEALQLPEIIGGTLEKILLSVVVISIFTAFYRLTDVFAAPLSRYRSSRFNRWSKQGVWEDVFYALSGSSGVIGTTASIDSTHIKAHRSASGAKGGTSVRRSDDHAADGRLRFMA